MTETGKSIHLSSWQIHSFINARWLLEKLNMELHALGGFFQFWSRDQEYECQLLHYHSTDASKGIWHFPVNLCP